MMIESADEFIRLRESTRVEEYSRAVSEEAPESVWLEIIRDNPEMRRWVAHNKTVPLAILTLLADDLDADVRSAVAQKRKLTTELFQRLSRDQSLYVRQQLAYNKKVPRSVLECLADDPDEVVSNAARDRLA